MGDGLLAGVASVPLDAPLGVEMMGYGARTGRASSQHDPLTARALYLRGASELLWIECDWCLVAPAQAWALRRRVTAKTGVPEAQVLLASIHTHSGPDTGFAALLTGREPEAYVGRLFESAVNAAQAARDAAIPARLGLGSTEVQIGRNRRVAEGAIDPEVLVIRVDRADRSPLAVLFVHGCHPTALGHDNLAYSADWPWAARESVERAFPGAIALFALGAHADVDPRTRGLLDLAIPGQSLGVSFAETEALGREVGEAVAEAAAALATSADAPIAAASSRIAIPVHGAGASSADGAAALEAARVDALRALDLPADSKLSVPELFRYEQERTRNLPTDERRTRVARVRRYIRDRTAPRFAFSSEPRVETQVLQVGEALFLALPAEPTVAVGREWKRRMGGGPAAVLGIANGWLRYLPHIDDFSEPDAHLKYEILQSTLVPDAADRLLAQGERLAEGFAA